MPAPSLLVRALARMLRPIVAEAMRQEVRAHDFDYEATLVHRTPAEQDAHDAELAELKHRWNEEITAAQKLRRARLRAVESEIVQAVREGRRPTSTGFEGL